MASFTTTISEIAEHIGNGTVEDAVESAAVFGLASYPAPSEAYRDQLNEKIIRRYWNREIAHESFEMFRFRMQTVMAEEMPYFNQLIASTQLQFDPFVTVDLVTVLDRDKVSAENIATTSGTTADNRTNRNETANNNTTNTGDNSTTHTETATNLSTNTQDSHARAVASITPQNQLSDNGDYADSINDNNTDTQNTTNANNNGSGSTGSLIDEKSTSAIDAETTENTILDIDVEGTNDKNGTEALDQTSSTKGYQAMPAKLLLQYRDTLINVDMQILDKLKKLFMVMTSTDDSYFERKNNSPYMYGYGLI